MRNVIAGIALALGVIISGLGVLQLTLWAPSDTVTAHAELPNETSTVVVEPGMLNLYSGKATLTATGEGDITIAQASKENVDAWVGDSAHADITGLSSQTQLSVTSKDGDPVNENPATADLFTTVQTGASQQSLDWDQDAGRTAFLIGTESGDKHLSDVAITFSRDAASPFAVPLLIVGGILILVGIVLFVLSGRQRKRDAQRREARRERRRRLAETGAAFAIVPALALAGCGGAGSDLPTPNAAAKPSTAQAVITDDQAKKIVTEAADDIEQADSKLDSKALSSRADGPFASQRKAAYSVKKKAKDADLPATIAADEVTLNYTSATDTWPRVTTVVTTDSDSKQSQLLVLSQNSARENYKVWSQTVLLSGSEIPSVNDSRQGSTLLDPDASGLVMSPKATLAAYAKGLGGDKKSSAQFGDDAYATQVKKSIEDQTKELKKGNASLKVTFDAGSELVAQQTADGGAVVVGSLTSTRTISPEASDGEKGTLTVPKPQSELVKDTSTSKKLESTYSELVAFVIPASGKGKPQLIGVSEALTGASLK